MFVLWVFHPKKLEKSQYPLQSPNDVWSKKLPFLAADSAKGHQMEASDGESALVEMNRTTYQSVSRPREW